MKDRTVDRSLCIASVHISTTCEWLELTSCILVLNSCLKLLEVQSGPIIVKSACNDRGTGVDVAGACGLREKKHYMLSLERWSAEQLATPGMYFGSNSMS